MWDLPGPGLEPVSPALAGGFLTTAPPGKSQDWILSEVWEEVVHPSSRLPSPSPFPAKARPGTRALPVALGGHLGSGWEAGPLLRYLELWAAPTPTD